MESTTDAQIIATAIAVLAVLAGSISNSVRIGDLNTGANRHLDDMRDVFLAEMDLRVEPAALRFKRLDSAINQRFERMDSKLDTIIAMLGQLDSRVTKLEGRSNPLYADRRQVSSPHEPKQVSRVASQGPATRDTIYCK